MEKENPDVKAGGAIWEREPSSMVIPPSGALSIHGNLTLPPTTQSCPMDTVPTCVPEILSAVENGVSVCTNEPGKTVRFGPHSSCLGSPKTVKYPQRQPWDTVYRAGDGSTVADQSNDVEQLSTKPELPRPSQVLQTEILTFNFTPLEDGEDDY